MLEEDPFQLMLFVRGNTARSASTIHRVRGACDTFPNGARALRIVDVFQEPQLVQKYRVVATPTLVTVGRRGERRFVGDVSEQDVQECFAGELDDER